MLVRFASVFPLAPAGETAAAASAGGEEVIQDLKAFRGTWWVWCMICYLGGPGERKREAVLLSRERKG